MQIHNYIITKYKALLIPLPTHKELVPGVPQTTPHHLWNMLTSIELEDVYADKAHRWLGFVQAILIVAKLTTVDAERNFTREYFD